MILCHTPLKQLVPKYKDDFVLVSGEGSILDICQAYGFKKCVHVVELFAMMPQIAALSYRSFPREKL